jgi:hypothetical protein
MAEWALFVSMCTQWSGNESKRERAGGGGVERGSARVRERGRGREKDGGRESAQAFFKESAFLSNPQIKKERERESKSAR